RPMNSANAFVFVLFGIASWLLPMVAPTWFPATGLDGSSGRALWLQTMGVVQTVVGMSFLVRFGVWPAVNSWLKSTPQEEPVWSDAAVPADATVVQPFAAIAALPAGESGALRTPWTRAALVRALRRAGVRDERQSRACCAGYMPRPR